jgi:hypothetical protein
LKHPSFNECFEGACYLYLQGRRVNVTEKKMVTDEDEDGQAMRL